MKYAKLPDEPPSTPEPPTPTAMPKTEASSSDAPSSESGSSSESEEDSEDEREKMIRQLQEQVCSNNIDLMKFRIFCLRTNIVTSIISFVGERLFLISHCMF